MMDSELEECPCTNCTNNLEHDYTSVRQFQRKRSKNKKIYHEKYLPPRERKLLDKLMKTRAMYDDIRNEILTDDECCDCCVVEDVGYRKQKGDYGDDEVKHAIRAIVNEIDKGEILPPEKTHIKSSKPLDDCQTYCRYDNDEHHYKNAQMHKLAKNRRKIYTYSSSQLHTKRKDGDRSRKRNVNFNAKNIHSEPCTCTLDILGVSKRVAPATKYVDSKTPTVIESKAIKAKKCVCEYNIKNASHIVKDAKDKIRQSIRSSISKLGNKFRIKKDSIIMFREKLKNKRAMKQYECETGYCIPEECLPVSCNKKLKIKFGSIKSSLHDFATFSGSTLKRIKKRKRKPNHICICEPEPEPEPAERPRKYYSSIKAGLSDMRNSIHDLRHKTVFAIKSISETSMKVISKIQSKRKQKLKSNHICICEPEPEPELEPEPEYPHKVYEKLKNSMVGIKKSFHEIGGMASGLSLKVVSKIQSRHKRKINAEPFLSQKRITKYRHNNNGLSIHIEPSIMTKKSTKKGRQFICECNTRHQKADTDTFLDSNLYSSLNGKNKLCPKECDAAIFIPDKCDDRECAKIYKSKHKSGVSSVRSYDKAVSNLSTKTSKHSHYVYEQPTNSEDKTDINPNKQIVRIGSNFSFNIEFYKESNNVKGDDTQTHIKIPNKKIVKNRARQSFLRRSRSRNKSVQSERRTLCTSSTCHRLKHCYCSLALKDQPMETKIPEHDKEKSSFTVFHDKKEKKSKAAICECDEQRVQKTQTMNDAESNSVKSASFARDSFFNSVKNCDYKLCNKKIRKSIGGRRHSIGTTSPSTTKYSVKSQCGNLCSNKQTESLTGANEFSDILKEDPEVEKTSGRNVVRIGSNFSFDIQFYKDCEPQYKDVPLKKNESLLKPKNVVRKTRIKKNNKKTNRSIITDARLSASDHPKSTFNNSQSQILSIQKNKSMQIKKMKKNRNNICERKNICTKQNSDSVGYMVSQTPPFKKCDPCCLYKDEISGPKHDLQIKKISPSKSTFGTSKAQMYSKRKNKCMKKKPWKNVPKNVCDECNTPTSQNSEKVLDVSPPTPFCTQDVCDKRLIRSKSMSNKSQTYPLYKNRSMKIKPRKKPKNICKCDVSIEDSGSVVFVMPPTPPLIPLNSEDACEPLCLLKYKNHGAKHKLQNKKVSTERYTMKSVSHNTVRSLTNASSSKRQMLKHRRKLTPRAYDSISDKEQQNRQAVRIGSSFSFNIEFSKDVNTERQHDHVPVIEKETKLANRAKYSEHSQFKTPAHTPKFRQKSIQVNKIQESSREPVRYPFLRKCLCTLKLLRPRKETILLPTQKEESIVYKTKSCQCKVRKPTLHSLYPVKYESTTTADSIMLSNGTSKSYLKHQDLQNSDLSEQTSVKKAIDDIPVNYQGEVSKLNKKIVRIGSNFSFNIEFYKERGDYGQNDAVNINPHRKINKTENISNEERYQNIPKRTFNKYSSAHTHSENYEITNLPASLIKRCLCNLKLSKKHRKCFEPHTRNKSVTAKESKKAYNKRILPLCECDKGIDTKSIKQLRKETYASAMSHRMKSVICSTDNKSVKSKAQKIQTDICKPCHKEKNNIEDLNSSTATTPQRKSVIISSSFNFNIEFNKEIENPIYIKPRDRHISTTRLSPMQRVSSNKNVIKERRSTAVNKKGIASNLGHIFKNCVCYQKDITKEKIEKLTPDKDSRINVSRTKACEPHLCEKSVMANRKQRMTKSVLDVKNPCLKANLVKSNLREASTKINSDQSIKRAIPKQRHRLHKTASKNVARLGSQFKFDVEFFKQFGSLEDDGSINYKKLKSDQRQKYVNDGIQEKISVKKINDKRFGPHIPRHREYQVGYMENYEMPLLTRKSPFQQQFDVCYVNTPQRKLWESRAIVYPAIIEGNPNRNIHASSNLGNKYMKTHKRNKKHVSFQRNLDRKIQTRTDVKDKCADTCTGGIFNLARVRQSQQSGDGKYTSRFPGKISLKANKFKNELKESKMTMKQNYDNTECACHSKLKRSKRRDKKRFTRQVNKSNLDGADQNKHLYNPSKFKDKNMKGNVEVIMPYSKRNFRKKTSRNCLQYKCAIKAYNEYSDQGISSTPTLHANKTYYGLLFAHKSSKMCNEVCIANGKTNLLSKSKTNSNIKKITSSPKKQKTLMNEKISIQPSCLCLSEQSKTVNSIKINTGKTKSVRSILKKSGKAKQTAHPQPVLSEHRKSVMSIKKNTERIKSVRSTIKKSGKAKWTLKRELTGKEKRKSDILIKRKQSKNSKNTKSDQSGREKSQKSHKETKDSKKAPCLCGSPICQNELKASSEKATRKLKRTEAIETVPPCTCGSKVCSRMSKLKAKRIKKRLANNVCKCKSLKQSQNHICGCSLLVKKTKSKKKAKKRKVSKKKQTKVERKQIECCKVLKKRRKKKEQEKRLKQYNQTSDTMLVAESVLDLVKMGGLLVWNTMKGAGKLVTDPEKSYEDLKKAIRDPDAVKKKCLKSRFTNIAIRLKHKIGAMRMTKKTVECLDSNSVSRFIIHSCDKDSSKRLRVAKRMKVRKERERIDFECSPFMASLRKRPYLWFYDRCPTLYPQFLSMLGLGRQFLDIMFFLLAIFVWSPCILAIEICRAFMCCAFCTG